MAKAKSEFLSAYLIMAQVVKALIDEVKNLNGNDDDIRRIENDPAIRRQIAELLVCRVQVISDLREQLGWWTVLWAEFGFTVDPTSITLPTLPAGFGPARLVVIPKGLTIQKAWDIAKSLFPCYSYISGSLDKEIPTNDRVADKDYAIMVRDRTEADEEFKNLSANDLEARNHKGITALETIVDEIGFYKKTDGHRDIQNVTLCTGSRDSVGYVPGSGWDDGGFRLDWSYTDYRNDNLRSRQAVSV
jgi:hypothetical protein